MCLVWGPETHAAFNADGVGSNVAPRRGNYGILHRGLKPTATITQPLRGGERGDCAAERQPKVAGRFNARKGRKRISATEWRLKERRQSIRTVTMCIVSSHSLVTDHHNRFVEYMINLIFNWNNYKSNCFCNCSAKPSAAADSNTKETLQTLKIKHYTLSIQNFYVECSMWNAVSW